MKHLYTLVSLLLLLSGSTLLNAQEPLTDKILIEFMKPGDPDAKARNYNLVEWPDEAKAAAYKAAEIWASYLEITVPIRVKFGWCDNILNEAQGGSTYSSQYTDDFYYPYPLLDQLLGYDKNPNVVDVFCVFNSNSTTGWYFGTDGEIGLTPDPNDPGIQYFQMDFLTTALHELCHGLGINGGSLIIDKELGYWGGKTFDKPRIYDSYICDKENNILINEESYENNSKDLASALISNNIYWNGYYATAANDGKMVKLYAPSQWSSSSICHIDTMYATTKNNLIAYNGVQSGNHQFIPGPIILGMLQDIGWSLKSGATANERIEVESPFKIYTFGNDIIIEGAGNNEKVLVCDFSGRVRYTGNGSGRISLEPGLYIVRVADKSFKIKL